MAYCIHRCGESRSFPHTHPLLEAGQDDAAQSGVYIGETAGARWRAARRAVTDVHQTASLHEVPDFELIELGSECLGEHIGEDDGPAHVMGFARFRLGDAEPTDLVELVKKPYTDPRALARARQVLEDAGLSVAVCNDFPGRILDRLIRPYYNAALRRLDEGLATAQDMDTTVRLGLGYPEGPIALLTRTGLHHHYAVTQALYTSLGQEAFVPARRAQVAWARHQHHEAP